MSTTKNIPYIIGAAIVNIIINTTLVWALWNWLCPLFNFPTLTWFESWGLWTLTRCLFDYSLVKVNTK